MISDSNQVHETQKRKTELKCSCGGALLEFRRVLLPKPPRTHRKKRIAKKWRKRWEKENRHLILASSMIGLLQRPAYRCAQCGKEEGFYSAMGRNMFKVEPLPLADAKEPTTFIVDSHVPSGSRCSGTCSKKRVKTFETPIELLERSGSLAYRNV